MFEVFNNDNVNDVVNKVPIICYYCSLGGCDSNGIMIVLFLDGTSYGYNSKFDINLVNKIVNAVSEFKYLLVDINIDYSPKRECIANKLIDLNLGLGNYAFVREDIFNQINDYVNENKCYLITAFSKILESNLKVNGENIFNKINSYMK